MGLLGSFIRGALGDGLQDYVKRADRRDELAAEAARQEQIRAEQREFMRQMQEDRQAATLERGAARGTSSGGARGSAAVDLDEIDRLVAQRERPDLTPEQIAEISAGRNPLKIRTGDPEMGPPTEKGYTERPDEDTFRAIRRKQAEVRMLASLGSNAENVANGERINQVTNWGRQAAEDTLRRTGDATGAAGTASLVVKGDPIYKDGQSGLLQQATGKVETTEVSRAAAAADRALAGKRAEETREIKDKPKDKADLSSKDRLEDIRDQIASIEKRLDSREASRMKPEERKKLEDELVQLNRQRVALRDAPPPLSAEVEAALKRYPAKR